MARSFFVLTKSWLRNQGFQNVVCFSSRERLPQEQNCLPFVPPCNDVTTDDMHKLQNFVDANEKILVLTGAGISTESGIPDYRSEGVGLYATSTNRPVQYTDFLKSADIRQRYWARNYVGWPRFSSFFPNTGHKVLSEWEKHEKIHWLVTQNVDALHYKAQSLRVTELHGSAHRVVCLSCQNVSLRTDIQKQIEAQNPTWHASSVTMAPDGDVSLTAEQIKGFKVPECQHCGGILKPDIIFFGDNVPRPTVQFVFDRLSESDAVLVVGSSLEVYSGYRFIIKAHDEGKPIAIVNIGKTRADPVAVLKISARCGEVLSQIQIK
ncbi:hypothetical protein C0Q70_06948 [Pomacea canaliculata]|uniref:NAD-dependent protein deacylase n=1 Tax=Pomacea canaliculata TaxID=400727 RepID=A0A2T7PDN7_POMCA|nr:NAD-dependent protein lipoamidase sirtuin-4, mitochondrial-like [Pomacea canaliculata]XP_025092801.1 NAD-dependent protein lipoamidase sirtuin-4, mitochondrial-like [Pomacea canaliculata]PVD31535.1 hypothetical protein C0Q70_06948 [Pomacea canaliculata]